MTHIAKAVFGMFYLILPPATCRSTLPLFMVLIIIQIY